MTRIDAVRSVTRGAQGAWNWVARIPNIVRSRLLDRQQAAESLAMTRRLPTAKERHEELIVFYRRYEQLVELLCDSAQYGPDTKQESRYQDLRVWMQTNYPGLRKFIVAYLQYDPADVVLSTDPYGTYSDAFEALFAAPTLAEFLRTDDGHTIDRIMRTRQALTLYSEHLRQLTAREAECA
ncbi:MAG: hypothetical protein KF784_14815 [Fimbriimonadaceae bacterium]|nr:hypothetical protein [Fimbriimonadaceae bacterium]